MLPVQTIITAVIILVDLLLCTALNPHKKFEYKLSFKGPHLVQRDGSVPFWEHGGHAIASDESIRITPSLRSKKGFVWSKEQVQFQNWEIEVTFRISGRGRIGADGLAIWYTADRGIDGGNVFGGPDMWKGMALFFDSFDNDNQHNNPYVMVMLNDGTRTYDHQSDGSSQQLGGCLRDFRNKPFPVKVKVEYYQRALTVSIHNGMTDIKDGAAYELCLRAENVDLPGTGYFGVSAATGGLADDHDVQSFITHSLVPPADAPVTGEQVPEDERKKFEQEFDDYWQKLQKAKEEFQRENPNATPGDMDEAKWFESQDTRELKQIFEGQSHIHAVIRDLNHKLDEVIGRQERTLSQISMMGQGGAPVQGQPGAVQGTFPVSRPEIEALINNQREMVQGIRDFRNQINDIQSRAAAIATQLNSKPAGGAADGFASSHQFGELKNSLNVVQNDLRSLVSRPQAASGNCPPPADVSCVSTMYFVVFSALQVIIIVGYLMYRNSKEAAAKKFY